MKIKHILICAIYTFALFILHMTSNVDSMLNNKNNSIDYHYLTQVVDYHENIQPTFVKRPIFTFVINATTDIFNISDALSFVIFNFAFIFISGLLLFYFSRLILKNEILAIISVSTFYLCFSNLFAFFPPIYTYEEPIQFVFIFLSFIFLVKKKQILFIISFSLALITRESAIFLIPGLFLLGISENVSLRVIKKEILSKKLILFTIPVIIYFLFTFLIIENNELYDSSRKDFIDRFSLLFNNFQNKTYSIESVSSFFLVLGMPIYFLIIYFKENKTIDVKTKKYVLAFIITLFINSLVVFTATNARESRLFVLPLFFLWPVFGLILNDVWKKHELSISKFLDIKNLIIFIVLTVINYKFSFQLYNVTIGDLNSNYFNEYLFISILIISFHFVFSSTFVRIKKSVRLIKANH